MTRLSWPMSAVTSQRLSSLAHKQVIGLQWPCRHQTAHKQHVCNKTLRFRSYLTSLSFPFLVCCSMSLLLVKDAEHWMCDHTWQQHGHKCTRWQVCLHPADWEQVEFGSSHKPNRGPASTKYKDLDTVVKKERWGIVGYKCLLYDNIIFLHLQDLIIMVSCSILSAPKATCNYIK